jgi:sulfoxide reductase catalytic subunit YedY
MPIRRPTDRIRPSQITPQAVFRSRRELLRGAGFVGAAALLGGAGAAAAATDIPARHRRLSGVKPSPLSVAEAPNSFEDITTYNNFYEFGLDKDDPANNSGKFRPQPWSVVIDGEAEVSGRFTYEDIIRPHALEERIYRFRCVEAWSMIIPWVGFPLGDLLKRFRPTSRARYVAFETVLRPEEMPGQRSRTLDWPYVEGLTLAEAMHPLTLMVIGVYGVELPNQNGAPLRLIVPWKYGFKSIKSIVRIRFTEQQPRTTWSAAAPGEYGFYANVNPQVDHPRWSQATERRIGSPFFSPKQPTLLFNGYAEQVAGLYRGLDLVRNF